MTKILIPTMIFTKTYAEYKRIRRENPFLPASWALQWAKSPDYSELWEEDSHGAYTREIDGFTVTLEVTEESYCPEPDSGLGHYVDCEQWSDGPEHKPLEETPLRLPPKIFASGAYSQDRNAWPYFFPAGVQEEYEAYRRDGASKSVAWMLAYEMVEKTIRDLFGAPLVNANIDVRVSRADVELGGDNIGTDYIDDREGRGYVFACVAEHGMVENALQEAREKLAALAA